MYKRAIYLEKNYLHESKHKRAIARNPVSEILTW